MKSHIEVQLYRDKTSKEIVALNNILFKLQERKEIPEEVGRLGFEAYCMLMISKIATLETIVDTLNWVIEEDI
jgi:hypothetical protein